MSYILDALRRADSERERERSAVPGLHTQAVPVGAPDPDVEAPANPWKWPIAAAFVALLGLVAWLWFGRADAPEPATPSASVPRAPAAPLTLPAAAPVTPAPTPVAAAGPPPAPAAASAAPVREPAPTTARKPPASAATSAATRKNPATAAAAASAAAKSVAKASEPEAKISSLNELPDEVRRELPAIVVSGSIYSKSAANRMLVINGQVFHEGDGLAAGLVLEQIRQKSAVLRFRTYRYEISY